MFLVVCVNSITDGTHDIIHAHILVHQRIDVAFAVIHLLCQYGNYRNVPFDIRIFSQIRFTEIPPFRTSLYRKIKGKRSFRMFCIVLFQQHPQHRIGIIPGAVFDLIITAREKFADNEFLFLGRESSQQRLTPPGRLHGNDREREFGDTLFRNCIPEHQIPVFQFTVVCQGLTLFTQQILDKLMLFFRKFTQEFQLFVPPYQFCRYRETEFLLVFRCCTGIEPCQCLT